MYADDICLMAPRAIALQKMLNLCYEFSLPNDIIFNPMKSQCMVFKPNRFKLYCPAVYLNGNIIDYVEKTKYLGYMFTNDKQDDVEMLRQLRLLYMRSNKIIRMFYFCTTDVKLELFRSFCTSFYCCYLWTGDKKSTYCNAPFCQVLATLQLPLNFAEFGAPDGIYHDFILQIHYIVKISNQNANVV